MIYIVSGFMRSGTSMMMRCLESGLAASGMRAEYSSDRNKWLDKVISDQNYNANPHGYYELPLYEYKELDFPKKYEGKLVKIMCWGIPHLSVGNYRIAFMRRDKEEVRQSNNAINIQRDNNTGPYLERYDEWMDSFERTLRNRKDVDLEVFRFRDVIENPVREFSKLSRWDIDVDQAAKQVDPSLYRFKLEELEVGI